MSDINYTINAQIAKGSLSQSFAASGVTANMATAGVLSLTLALNTNSTQIATATLGSLGLCFARSLATSTTHEVSFGRLEGDALHETVRLRANEAAVLRLAPGQYAARASVAGTTRMVLTIYED